MRGFDLGGSRAAAPRKGRWTKLEQQRLRELYGRRDEAAIARELNRPVGSVRRMAERLFPQRERGGPWTGADDEVLKRHLGAAAPEVIARILGRSVDRVQARIVELGRCQEDRSWTREELAFFKRVHGTRTDEDLARIFGRSRRAVEELARSLALSKDKVFLRRVQGLSSSHMPRWDTAELEALRRDYPLVANLEIARRLGRSVKSVVSKAHSLGLRKSHDRLREMGRQNVRLRYPRAAGAVGAAPPRREAARAGGPDE